MPTRKIGGVKIWELPFVSVPGSVGEGEFVAHVVVVVVVVVVVALVVAVIVAVGTIVDVEAKSGHTGFESQE